MLGPAGFPQPDFYVGPWHLSTTTYPCHDMNGLILIVVSLGLCLSMCLTAHVRLESAIASADTILRSLRSRWRIDEFPNFLSSPIISHTSWQILKLKFERKILSSILNSSKHDEEVSFVMSFMGSSVTAGHDSPFNQSYAMVVKDLMDPAFKALGIKLISRNVAIGNNPCIPYDLCPRTFAGADADLIHWEQGYNCNSADSGHSYIFEQFIRQAMGIPSQPVIVFSDSIVPNWDAKDCTDSAKLSEKKMTRHDMQIKQLLDMSLADLAQSLNRMNQSGQWSMLDQIATAYKTMGIQFWMHRHYEVYKCRGPYVANWGCCSAPWHPSILGHELVASHFAYFWLLIYKDALLAVHEKIKTSKLDGVNDQALHEMRDLVDKRIHRESYHLPATPLYPRKFNDGIRCYTTFEPRSDPEANLLSLIVRDRGQVSADRSFSVTIYENVTRPEIIKMARQRGYQDFKYMIYGNNESSPLHFLVKIQRQGHVFICQPPSDWERHPPGFGNLWDLQPTIWLTQHVDSHVMSEGFELYERSKQTRILSYLRSSPSLESLERICIESDEMLLPGQHILTIRPKDIGYVMISYLLLP
jgi:hypothetical protein